MAKISKRINKMLPITDENTNSLTLPSNKEALPVEKIEDQEALNIVIRRGGDTPHSKFQEAVSNKESSKKRVSNQKQPGDILNFSFLYTYELGQEIDKLRDHRPKKPRSPKKGVSIQDWIEEAVYEKIEREKKLYGK